MIAWAVFFSCVLAVGAFLFLLIGGCAVKIASDVDKKFDELDSASRTSVQQMQAADKDIKRRLQANYQNPTIPSSPSQADPLRSAAQAIAEWDAGIAASAGEAARRSVELEIQRQAQRQRDAYKGLPGHYDKSGFPGKDR